MSATPLNAQRSNRRDAASWRDLHFGCVVAFRRARLGREKVGGPIEALAAQPGGGEAGAAVFAQNLGDGGLDRVLEEAAQKASATSPSPSSNSRLPRADWQ